MARASTGRIRKRAASGAGRSSSARRRTELLEAHLAEEGEASGSARGDVEMQEELDEDEEAEAEAVRQNVEARETAMGSGDAAGGQQREPSQDPYRLTTCRARKGSMGIPQDTDTEEPGKPQSICPIIDKDTKPFPLMMLPPEVRNEIYRACLTRPFNVLLSRQETPTWPQPQTYSEDDVNDPMTTSWSGPAAGQAADGDGSLAPRDRRPRRARTAARRSGLHPSSSDVSLAGRAHPAGPASQLGMNPQFYPTPNGFAPAPPPTINMIRAPQVITVGSRNQSRRIPRRNPVPRRDKRPQDVDPLIVNLLQVSKTVYNEARSILYSENMFTLDLETSLPTLAALHQRSRRQIKHIELEIPCYNEILERFQETVRLSLRYCWGLKTLVIHMPFTLPGADGSGTAGNTTVYANGFDILRWLPRPCEVVLKGNVCAEIEAVVSKNANLAKTLDELAYARRQLVSNEGPSQQ